MSNTLNDWEKHLDDEIRRAKHLRTGPRATLLPAVPDRVGWELFTQSVNIEWKDWKSNLPQRPSCLMVLYCGLAFYEYDENRFWPQFSKVVGNDLLPANRQTEINNAFAGAINHLQLKLKSRTRGIDFVGSAVDCIGVPLSLWDGFLEICEWALWRKDWKSLSDKEWTEVIEKRAGSRGRLKSFLADYRESASALIQEMLDARDILTTDTKLTISDIAQASILRAEYFEEVPETADFLRPANPDSLFQNRARITWNENKQKISLQLPAVEREKMPAIWRVGEHQQKASSTPDEMIINLGAFSNSLLLNLEDKTGVLISTQRVRGIGSWGLFDLESGGRLVNTGREQLPIKSYILVSQKQIEITSREGFDEDGGQINEPFEFTDGVSCFVTRLWPTGKYAEVCLKTEEVTKKIIRFRTRAKIEAHFIIGRQSKAGYFGRTPQNKIKMDHLPMPCVSIPHGYFKDNLYELKNAFKVYIDAKMAFGCWEKLDLQSTSCDHYQWRWDKKVYLEQRQGINKVESLKQLSEAYKAPDLRGDRVISIEASPYIRNSFNVYIVDRTEVEINKCWNNLPGAYLPMFLLSQPAQSAEGLKWEDLMLAREIIEPRQYFSPRALHRYQYFGLAIQRGQRWSIGKNLAELAILNETLCQLNYCGDPSILWNLYRRMYHEIGEDKLPTIEVINERGQAAYLKMDWPVRLKNHIEGYLKRSGVVIGKLLWTH